MIKVTDGTLASPQTARRRAADILDRPELAAARIRAERAEFSWTQLMRWYQAIPNGCRRSPTSPRPTSTRRTASHKREQRSERPHRHSRSPLRRGRKSQGWRPVRKVAVPLLVLTGLPLLLPWRRTAIAARTVSTGLLFFGVLLGALSFWILYLPAAVLMLIAMIRALEERRLLEGTGQVSPEQAP